MVDTRDWRGMALQEIFYTLVLEDQESNLFSTETNWFSGRSLTNSQRENKGNYYRDGCLESDLNYYKVW